MENLNRIQPICLLSVRDRSHVPKINRNVLLERSNPSWRILSSQGHQPPRRYAQRYTATEIQYPTPGKNALGCHASRKFTDWSMSPDTPYPRTFSTWNHDTRFYAPVNPARELSTLSFLSSFFLLLLATFHPSGERGGCSSIVGKSEEVFVHLMDITDKQRNPYRNIYTVKFLFRGYNFSSPADGYRWKTIHRRGSNVPAQHLLFKIYDVD